MKQAPSHPTTCAFFCIQTHTQSPRVLHSVTLFDSFLTDYNITGAVLFTAGGQQKLNGLAKAEKGAGILFNQKFHHPDKIQIKVTVKCLMYMYMDTLCTLVFLIRLLLHLMILTFMCSYKWNIVEYFQYTLFTKVYIRINVTV